MKASESAHLAALFDGAGAAKDGEKKQKLFSKTVRVTRASTYEGCVRLTGGWGGAV